jgi:hypothetical protein
MTPVEDPAIPVEMQGGVSLEEILDSFNDFEKNRPI